MAERSRVTPLGDIVAIPLRGAFTGNRGRLHSGKTITRLHSGNLWITCALEFRGRWSEQWQPHHYTFLYFHDEAVSFAAGRRPWAGGATCHPAPATRQRKGPRTVTGVGAFLVLARGGQTPAVSLRRSFARSLRERAGSCGA